MKFYILPLILAILLLQGCTTNNASTAQDGKKNQSNQPATTPAPIQPSYAPTKPPVPAENGKTTAAFFDFLKSKGYQMNDFRPVAVRMFGCEESAGFRDERNIGYLVLRYENSEKAKANFTAIDDTYRQRFGRALISNNFILANFCVVKGSNKPVVIKLEDSDYPKLQAALDEFFKK
jgi:hypothetical protein